MPTIESILLEPLLNRVDAPERARKLNAKLHQDEPTMTSPGYWRVLDVPHSLLWNARFDTEVNAALAFLSHMAMYRGWQSAGTERLLLHAAAVGFSQMAGNPDEPVMPAMKPLTDEERDQRFVMHLLAAPVEELRDILGDIAESGTTSEDHSEIAALRARANVLSAIATMRFGKNWSED